MEIKWHKVYSFLFAGGESKSEWKKKTHRITAWANENWCRWVFLSLVYYVWYIFFRVPAAIECCASIHHGWFVTAYNSSLPCLMFALRLSLSSYAGWWIIWNINYARPFVDKNETWNTKHSIAWNMVYDCRIHSCFCSCCAAFFALFPFSVHDFWRGKNFNLITHKHIPKNKELGRTNEQKIKMKTLV